MIRWILKLLDIKVEISLLFYRVLHFLFFGGSKKFLRSAINKSFKTPLDNDWGKPQFKGFDLKCNIHQNIDKMPYPPNSRCFGIPYFIFMLLLTSECDFGSKKWIKYQNSVRNAFGNIKIPLGNDMGHWNGIFWSLWKNPPPKNASVPVLGGKKNFHVRR